MLTLPPGDLSPSVTLPPGDLCCLADGFRWALTFCAVTACPHEGPCRAVLCDALHASSSARALPHASNSVVTPAATCLWFACPFAQLMLRCPGGALDRRLSSAFHRSRLLIGAVRRLPILRRQPNDFHSASHTLIPSQTYQLSVAMCTGPLLCRRQHITAVSSALWFV